MSDVTPISKPAIPPDPKADEQLALIRGLAETLPVAHQQKLIDELAHKIRAIPASRAGEVLNNIVRFLPERAEWTATEIKERLAASGVEVATSRPIFNAIGYLERKKQIERLGEGRYRVNRGHGYGETREDGTVVTSAYDAGGGTVRGSEHL
jgi:hypothetical protein